MSINDRIKQILNEKNLSPSHFADEIGVQRSSISHILSERNRPSFDIIQKIIRRFPELGYEWILEEDEPLKPPLISRTHSSKESEIESRSRIPAQNSIILEKKSEKAIERILIFYTNGTFREYIPE